MTFEEWWMDQEYDPMIYGPMSDAWAASQAVTREECAALCDRFAERDMHPAECAAAIRGMK